MKNTYRKVRRFIKFGIYRMMRTDMVLRMYHNGLSWTKINSVLRVLGQKQVVRVERGATGMRLSFNYVPLKKTAEFPAGQKARIVEVEPSPEIINLD